jgi:hypothetical protein
MRQIVIDIIHDNRHVMYGEIDIMRQIVIDIIHDNSNVRRRDWYYATTVMCSVFVKTIRGRKVHSYERVGCTYRMRLIHRRMLISTVSTVSTRNGWTCVSIRQEMYARSC